MYPDGLFVLRLNVLSMRPVRAMPCSRLVSRQPDDEQGSVKYPMLTLKKPPKFIFTIKSQGQGSTLRDPSRQGRVRQPKAHLVPNNRSGTEDSHSSSPPPLVSEQTHTEVTKLHLIYANILNSVNLDSDQDMA